ncbi:MAG: EAL domain-containing protein [Deltaproteobacteria bacterium]|nr:EAL domain-containing protein [Deltaproteobacteria bacterium]
MIFELLDLSNYSLGFLSLQTLFTSIIVSILGIIALIHERFSRIGMVFFGITQSIALWLFAYSWIYSSPNIQFASAWAKVGHFGIVMISPACYHFATLVNNKVKRRFRDVPVVWLVSFVPLIFLFFTDIFERSIQSTQWGYYPFYEAEVYIFLVYFLGINFLATRRLWQSYRNAIEEGVNLTRIKILLVAFCIGYLASFDFALAFGFSLYPFGYIAIMIFILLCTFVVLRYRFVDITPAFAALPILRTMREALLVLDRDLIVRVVNPAACNLFGIKKSALLGRRVDHTIINSPPFNENLNALIRYSSLHHYEIEYCHTPGDQRILSVSNTIMNDSSGKPQAVVCVARDITEYKRSEERIRFLAYYDSLTGLPNRTFCSELLSRSLERAKRYSHTMALLFVDLDNFKRINDTLGHEIGDQLLKVVAQNIGACIRGSDHFARAGKRRYENIVSRLGGDEFIILLSEIRQPSDSHIVAQRILDIFTKSINIAGNELFITASIGIALFPIDSIDVDSLLRNADAAMYHAKTRGKNNYQFYNETMNASAHERLKLEHQLHKAIERNEFSVSYQPVATVNDVSFVGCEALIRWNHPEHGELLPDEFIQLAEECGLILPIGEWMITAVCMQQRIWRNAGLKPVRVAVNLSSRQLEHPDMVEIITDLLSKYDLDVEWLEFEITESAVMYNSSKALETLERLNKMKIKLNLDDFGTGYSSLAYVRRIPFNVIKIDRSLINNMLVDHEDATITAAIIAMAHSLKLKIIAEGVTNEQELIELRKLGCDEFQGFMYSKPLKIAEFTTFLKERQIC